MDTEDISTFLDAAWTGRGNVQQMPREAAVPVSEKASTRPDLKDARRHAATFTYQQSRSMQGYKRDSGLVNKALRSPHLASKAHAEHNRDREEDLRHVTNNRLKKAVTVYRGGDQDPDDFEEGDTFRDKGFTGTTFSHNVAKTFGETRFKIHAPAGVKAHYIDADKSLESHEKELLLHPGTKFTVTHKVYDKDGDGAVIHVTAHPHDDEE